MRLRSGFSNRRLHDYPTRRMYSGRGSFGKVNQVPRVRAADRELRFLPRRTQTCRRASDSRTVHGSLINPSLPCARYTQDLRRTEVTGGLTVKSRLSTRASWPFVPCHAAPRSASQKYRERDVTRLVPRQFQQVPINEATNVFRNSGAFNEPEPLRGGRVRGLFGGERWLRCVWA